MSFLEAFPGEPRRFMPYPRKSAVAQYLLSAIMLTSFIKYAHTLPLMEMDHPSVASRTTPKPDVGHHRHRHRHHNHSDSHRGCPFGIGGHVGDQVHCCKNGGVPVMNRCACPRNFGGDYCELKKKNCFHIPHGGVFTEECSLCTCQYGIVSCISRVFKSCGSNPKDAKDDGHMVTYDLRSRHQKLKALKKYPMLLKATSSGHSSSWPSMFTITLTLLASVFLQEHNS